MLNVLAKYFMTATRNTPGDRWETHSHWIKDERFDNCRRAEIEAHLEARRRD